MQLRPGFRQTELGPLPENWEVTTVNGLASSVRNAIVGGPFGSDLVSRDYVADGIPVIRGQNMGKQWITGPFVFVTSNKADSLEANLAHPDDVVFTQRGTLGQVSLVPHQPYSRYLVSQSQMKVTLNRATVDPVFSYYLFSGEMQQERIRQNTIQTGLPHINLGILRGISVPRPPLPEQRAIATALSDVGALLTKLDQLVTKKRDLKQAAMQQLLTGQTRLPGFSAEWERQTLANVFSISAGKSKSAYLAPGGQHWVVDMGSVSTDGKLVVSKATNYASDFLTTGDLVMPKDDIGGGGIIGKVGYIDAERTYVLGDHVYRLRATRGHSLFLSFAINGHRTNSELRKKVIGTAQLGLSRRSVNEQEIPFPPHDEQVAIASFLSDMDTEIAALDARRDKTRALKQGMMQELLTGRIRLV